MPYKVTSIRDQYRYQSVVPRRLLAHTIIKFLKELGLNLNQLKDIIARSHCNPHMIVSEAEFKDLVEVHPGLDFIYDSIILTDNSRIYYHTNWTVGKYNWQLMVDQLKQYDIEVITIQTPELSVTVKTKEPIQPSKH